MLTSPPAPAVMTCSVASIGDGTCGGGAGGAGGGKPETAGLPVLKYTAIPIAAVTTHTSSATGISHTATLRFLWTTCCGAA